MAVCGCLGKAMLFTHNWYCSVLKVGLCAQLSLQYIKYYLPRVTKKQKRLSTMVSIIASISVSIISGLLIAERRAVDFSATRTTFNHLLKCEKSK